MQALSTHKEKLQRFGRFLTKMVMPNIGAFIAWGLLTAIFNENGWYPNAELSQMIDPMMRYLLPMLIGYTGGRMVGGVRGGVVGSIATMGVITGTDIPMFMGAMLIGPFGGWVIQQIDQRLKANIPMGFEMLTSNFAAGIVGFLIAIVGYKLVGPVVQLLSLFIESGVYWLIRHKLLFLASLFIEPGKILFLNNAINHGILDNLGIHQVSEAGKSVFFLLESNPGPGLGILLATYWHGKKSVKETVPGAAVIHFFGGIHEIYFPYVLASPALFLAVILGGMSGVLTMNLLNVGLVATPSPGSIFAILAMSPRTDVAAVLVAIGISVFVTFGTAHIILSRLSDTDKETEEPTLTAGRQITKIVFACDTGMGSSAMGAALVGKMLEEAHIKMVVENAPIDELPNDADLIVTIEALKSRAVQAAPNAVHIGIQDFLNKAQYERLIEELKLYGVQEKGNNEMSLPNAILMQENIYLNLPSVSKEAAICHAGEVLAKSGYVEPAYIEGMLAREAKFTTYIGNGVAIPHGENEVKDKIVASGLVVLQYPNGIDFGDGNMANLVIGIAGKGNEHMQLLSNIAEAIEDEALLAQMVSTSDKAFIFNLLSQE